MHLLNQKPHTLILFFIFLFLFLTPLHAVNAQNPLVPCTGLGDNPCTIQHIIVLLQRIYNFLVGLTSFVAIIFIIWGGIQMFSPSPNGVEGGKKTLMYAITGLVIILTSYLVINTAIYILSGRAIDLPTIMQRFPV